MGDAGLGVVTLFVAHDHDRLTAEAGQAADDRLIVAELTVAVQFHEVGEQALEVVDEVRALRVARDLGAHPRVKIGVGLDAQGVGLLAQGGDLGLERAAGRGQMRQLRDLGFQLGDGLFEFEVVRGHKASVRRKRGWRYGKRRKLVRGTLRGKPGSVCEVFTAAGAVFSGEG
ncbi:hypothetical protein D3C81_1412760 [compost metagenome]